MLPPSLSAQSKDLRHRSTYHPGSQKLKAKASYYYDAWSEQEIRHGKFSAWDPQGILREEAHFYEGALHGKQLLYDKRGKLIQASHWSYGQRNGLFHVFHLKA